MLTLTTTPPDLLARKLSGPPPGVREAETVATERARDGTRAASEGFAQELAEVRARERADGFGAQRPDPAPRDSGEEPGDGRRDDAGHRPKEGEEAPAEDRDAPASPGGGTPRPELRDEPAHSTILPAASAPAPHAPAAAGLAAGAASLVAPAAGLEGRVTGPAQVGSSDHPGAAVTPLVGSRAAVAAGAAGAAPTTQAPAPAPAPVPVARLAVEHRDSIFKQVALKLEDSGASSMELLLEPPELGLLSLSLDLDGGRIRLVVGAERPEVAEQMRSHMLELRAALQAQGLEVTHFEVRAGTGDRGESGAHAGGSRRRGGSSPVEIGRGAPGVRLLEGSSLDILV